MPGPADLDPAELSRGADDDEAASDEPASDAPPGPAGDEPPGPAPAPRAATPDELAAAAAWRPPPRWSDRFSDLSRRGIRAGLAALGALALVGSVVLGVPVAAAVRSPGYDVARARLERDPGLTSFLGRPLRADVLPVAFRLGAAESRFVFRVRGPLGVGCGEVTTRGAELARVRLTYASEPPLAWLRGAR